MKLKIAMIWIGVAVVSVAMVWFFQKLGREVPGSDSPLASNIGREEVDRFFPIKEDLELTRQDGEKVMLGDLKGKVTVLAQFFAVCPMCAERNAVDLKGLYQEFRDHPDFQMVCVTVDPETDGVEQLTGYAEALGAGVEDWWFVTAGDETRTHDYLENELGFFGVRERRDPVDIASKGKFSHDLGLLVIDRDFNVIGKWPLADARSEAGRERDPDLYERLKADLYERLERQLENPDEREERVAEAP